MDASQHVNPYIAGSPVTGTEMFFGREDVFSYVRSHLTGRHRDAPIVLYGQRRTGKTSVLYQMHHHLDPRYRCILIDLHGLNLDGVENLLRGIANTIKRGLQHDHQLQVTLPDRATFSADPQTAFETTFLDAVWSALGEDHLVLMIDEVIRLHEQVQAGRLQRDVFDYLRHLMQHFERLNFIFSLGSGVEEMKKDLAFLFGVPLYKRISFLEPVTAQALITEPVRGCYQVAPDAVEKILQITSGHPYYTQLVCHCLFNRWLQAPKSQMTSADVDAILDDAIMQGSGNLTYVWLDSTPEEQAAMAGMAAAIPARGGATTLDQIREAWADVEVPFPSGEAATAIRNLIAREVAVRSEGVYSFAVDLQRLWLDKHKRLDWVKGDLAEAAREWAQPPKAETSAREWAQPPKAETSAEDKPPDRPLSPRPKRVTRIAAVILVLIVVIALASVNLHSTAGVVETAVAVAITTAFFITIAFLILAGWLFWVSVRRRRPQVVIEDVGALEGIPQATSGLSPQLRQAVSRLVLRERERGDVSYAVLKTLKQDIDDGLLRTHGHVQMRTIAAGLRSSTEDSLVALTAGIRAVAPSQAEGLETALGALLPSQRGWVVRTYPVLRGEGGDADIGLTLELAQFEHAPDAVTSFWTSSEALRKAETEAAQATAMRSLLHRLLEPAALWIEIRLVARQLEQSSVPMSWRLLFGRQSREELAGLHMQLAGQMSLYAATEQEVFYQGFADQALADLAEAVWRLPTYFRPHYTAAAVHERLGWGYRRSNDLARAADEFERAVRRYDAAAERLAAAPGAAPEPRDAALERVKVRRAKCRLLTDDRSQLEIAQRELAELLRITGSTALELYNSACLFAVAMSSPDIPEEVRSAYAPHAWHLLGRALLAEGADGPWANVMTDVDLDALDQQKRRDFCVELKVRHPELAPLNGEAAQMVVKQAMHAIGIEPPSNP